MSTIVRALLVIGLASGGASAAAEDRPLETGDFVMPKEECEIRSGDKIVPLKGRIMPFVVQSVTGDQVEIGCGRTPVGGLVRLEDADAYYTEWLQRHPRSVDAYHLRSIVRYEALDYPGAIADLDAAIALIPNIPRLYVKRAMVSRLDRDPKTKKLKNPDQIRADCKRAIELNRNEILAYCLRLSLDIELNPELKISLHEDFSRMQFIPPKDAESCFMRGGIFRALQLPVQAIRDFDMAIDLEPYVAMYYTNRGACLGMRGRNTEALRDFDTAIRLSPKDVYCYTSRAGYYLDQNEPKLALADADKALEMMPDNLGMKTGLANMLCSFKDPAYRNGLRAMKLANDAYVMDPLDWRSLTAMGTAYAELGDFEKAEEFYLKAYEQRQQMSLSEGKTMSGRINRIRLGLHPMHD